ncbi:MAG: CoA transferase, partial [Quisquiliibacterium sp.]
IAIVSERFLTREMAWWQARLAEYDIPHALMANYPEAADDPQKAAIEAIVPMLHPQLGQIRTISSPFQLSDYEKVPAKPAPGLGQHTREVLTEIGLDKDTIEAIVNAATTD